MLLYAHVHVHATVRAHHVHDKTTLSVKSSEKFLGEGEVHTWHVHCTPSLPFFFPWLSSALQRGRWTSCAGPGAAATLSFESWHGGCALFSPGLHLAASRPHPLPSAPQKGRWTSCAGPGTAATLSFESWHGGRALSSPACTLAVLEATPPSLRTVRLQLQLIHQHRIVLCHLLSGKLRHANKLFTFGS